MKKTIFTYVILFATQLYSLQSKEILFEKKCQRCHKIAIETQLYVYDEWTKTWQKSWRSDTNRPCCCQECYFALQPKQHFLQRPMNAYSIGNYDVSSSNEDNSNYTYKWWNNGIAERFSRSKPIGIGWTSGRLQKQ